MSRVKLVLALVVSGGVAILLAMAAWPYKPSDADRELMEQQPPGESVAVRENRSLVKPPESDKVLKNFIKLPGESDRTESDRTESNAPRMQTKQIKMH
jgi:hypothetical protein